MESLHRRDLEKSVYDACRSSPAGADLLVSAFVQSLCSTRCSSVCIPFPIALFQKAGEKDFHSVKEAVQHFPQIHRISSFSKLEQCQGSTTFNSSSKYNESCNLATSLQVLPLQSLRLLSWLLRMCLRFQIVLNQELSFLSHGRAESRLGCLPDFVLKVQEEDQGSNSFSIFAEVKARSGSMMAFHGTSAENLHSILRCGLLNLSNTSLQRNGAIYGEGIYLSTDIAVAFSFSKASKGWERSCFGERVRYVLLCEVAKGDGVLCSDHIRAPVPNSTPRETLGTYIVVRNSDLVRLRYILVYAEAPISQSHPASNGDTTASFNPAKPTLLLCFRKVDWCKMIIVVYVALLLGVAFLKS